jgi:hypothetical protein
MIHWQPWQVAVQVILLVAVWGTIIYLKYFSKEGKP